ncbi:MAG: response regulator [bacterium]|nr:response regulator [bacterium]
MSETVCSKPVIAICDDDQSMRQLTERVLIRTGQYAVETFNSGSELLEYASSNPLNLVLLDVRLPGEDGFKVCEQLLEIPECEQLPVLFLSGDSDVDTIVVGFSKGAVDYITKPVKSQELKARIDTHLKVQRLQRELQESKVKYQMLVHVLCHDLANYVGAIYNMAQFLKRSDSVNDAQGFFPRIYNASYRAFKFLKTVHEIVAGEEGRLSMEVKEHEALGLVEESASILKSKFDSKKIKLSIDNCATDAKVKVDRNWFVVSILNNLLSNACKYSYPDSVVQLKLSKADHDLVITVRDHGVGMLPKQLTNLNISTLAQSSPGTSGEKGSGMGIPLVKRWVSSFGGQISIDSTHESLGDDHGTEITLSFPMVI